ncbi:MAG: cell wall hydrolase [Bdellovibrionales bacterium]|nr:cell wall hydrolase [Bdellovibrionales bacterium]NQZ18833.1 cell wall hydrolase [Bdellovibrionales bacterium]
MPLRLFLILFSISLFSLPTFAGDYCKRGRYYHTANSNVCRNRATDYCFNSRRGYYRGSSEETVVSSPGQAGFCRRGRYYHHSNSSACSGREINYCFTRRRGYHRCEQAGQVPIPDETQQEVEDGAEPTETTQTQTTTPQEGTTQSQDRGDYCFDGRYWHHSHSPACRGRAIDQCRINGRYQSCDGSQSTADTDDGGSSGTAGAVRCYQRMTCTNPRTPFACMMCACYHEARGESAAGRLAVGKVIMTRARMRAYPNSVCGVVKENQNHRYPQFSFWRGGARHNTLQRVGYNRCEPQVRQALAYNGHYASHYHTTSVFPRWRRNCRGRFQIGVHYFYRDCGSQSRARTDVRIDL